MCNMMASKSVYLKSTILLISFVSRVLMILQGDHICYNEETYTELEQYKTTHPVNIRSYNWCFSMPPRCSNYRTEIREVTKFQNVTKTRITEFCCVGYAEVRVSTTNTINSSTNNNYNNNNNDDNNDDNSTIRSTCEPTCRGGCGEGVCAAPNQCACNVGYEGRHCSQRCRFRMYGPNCRKVCRCRNGALCDHRTGFCRCTAGWTGEMCELPCLPGYFGMMCRNTCNKRCTSGRCNAQTGECVADDSHIVFDWSGGGTRTEVNSNIMKLSLNDRIQAKHWISVNGNGKISLKNCTHLTDTTNNCTEPEKSPGNSTTQVDGVHLANLIDQTHRHHVLLHNNNSLIMDALNSSIANLTSDVGKLSKQLDEQKHIVVEHVPQVHEMAFILDPTQSILGAAEPLTTTLQESVKLIAVRESMVQQMPKNRSEEAKSIDSNNVLELVSTETTDANEVLHILTLGENNQTMVDSQHVTASLGHHNMDNPPMVPVVLVVLVALILVALVSFVLTYVIRRANGAEPVGQRVTRRAQHVQEIKMCDHVVNQKPLPDIPSFTQSFTRREAEQQEFYDRPSNNLSVPSGLNTLGLGYSYTTKSEIGIPTKIAVVQTAPAAVVVAATNTATNSVVEQTSRKPSLEHIYDEIKYADRQSSTEAASRR